MRVLADYHHHDLWESLELTLTDRFGWDLYRPMGMEWFDAEYWNFERTWHGDRVARQYLEPWGSDTDTRFDKSHERYQKLLTLAEARDNPPDLVIASVAHNHEGFARFAKEVGATFAIHLGNVRFSEIDMAEDRWDLASFGIVTTKLPVEPPKPHVVIHQEFSLADFRYEPPQPHDRFRISSFVNCFAENRHGYGQFRGIADHNPEFDWRVYGSYGSAEPDQYACGNIGRCADVAAEMRTADIAWHTKIWSDGFGHVIHDWFAVGRPVFGYAGYYANQLAGPLWQEGVTSYNIEGRSTDEVVAIIRGLQNDPDRHRQMCEAAAARFREVVSFDEDAAKLRALIEAHVR